MKRALAALLFALGFMCAPLAGALTGLERVFLDPARYTAIQDELNVYDSIGLSRDDQMLVNADLAAYLAGRSDSLERNVTLLGKSVDCAFNERELSHMRDVKALFSKGLAARAILAVAAVAFLIAPFALKAASGRGVRRGALIALAALLICGAAGCALFETAGFDSVFIRFHQLFFDNDLWLLDPAADAMIRMFPEPFFARMALQGGVCALGFAAGMLAAAWAMTALAAWKFAAFIRRKP